MSAHSEDATVEAGPGLARSAGLLALGNVGSRFLGLLREVVIAAWFGASGQVSAYRIAAQVPALVYDLFVGGILSAALVPVLSQTAQRRRSDFVQLAGVLLGVLGSVLALLALLLLTAAPAISSVLAAGFRTDNPELFDLTTRLIRLMAPAVWFFSVSGLLTAILYALQRFTFPAIGTAIFNLGIVVSVPALAGRFGIAAAALGVLIGSLSQGAVMAWDVRRAGVSLRPRFVWNHPALRQILRLTLPIAVGLVVMLFQVTLDRRLASGTGEQSIAWMAAATTLQQMPLGLISVAISLAALPSLSRFFAAGDAAGFRRTLVSGLRFVLLLIVPSAVALFLLAEPVTRLLFERGAFTPQDTQAVVAALRIYLLGMLFAAVDYPLNYSYYARSNTLLPALVGIGSVVVYVVIAFSLVGPLGYRGLVWADTAKQAAHALVMAWFVARALGRTGSTTVRGLAQITLAGAAMAGVTAGALWLLGDFASGTALGDVMRILVAGGAGASVYLGVLALLRFEELSQVWRRVGGGAIIGKLR